MSDVIKIDTTDQVVYGSQSAIQEYTLLELVPETDSILKEIMPVFDFTNPPTDPTELASELVENCKGRNGFGLSANQVGLRYRVFIMGSDAEYVAFFNPKILKSSDKKSLIVEGCLSFPMLGLKIERPETVEVEYQDYNGQVRTGVFSGLSAHVFQHEMDHLNGITYLSKAKPLALKYGLNKRKKFHTLVDRYNKAQKHKENLLKISP